MKVANGSFGIVPSGGPQAPFRAKKARAFATLGCGPRSLNGYVTCMSEQKRDDQDDNLADGILDADDTGLVRNEVNIVEEEIEEGLAGDEASPEEVPVDESEPEGRPTV
jgi:hypothetical protein